MPSANMSSSYMRSTHGDQVLHQQQNNSLRNQPQANRISPGNLSNGWQIPTKEMTTSLSLREIMQQEKLLDTRSDMSPVNAGANTWAAKAAQVSVGTYNRHTANAHGANPERYCGQLSNGSNLRCRESVMHRRDYSSTSNEKKMSADCGTDSNFHEAYDASCGEIMSQEFSEWCTNQLLKIAGNGDLTLVSFCLTIDSAAEIRETLAAYLGSTPQVSQFATEFIKKKEHRANALESGFKKVTKKKSNKR